MRRVVFPAAVLLLLSCTSTDRLAPSFDLTNPLDLPAVRISELHYDNTGTDAGERIEISGPAGTDLTGWQVIL